MKKRILSLLLVAVIMFTTFAFEMPIGIDAYNITSSSWGWYGRELWNQQLQYKTSDAANRCFNVTSAWNSTENSVRIKCDTSSGSSTSSAPYISIPLRFDGIRSAAYNYVTIVYRYPCDGSNSSSSYSPRLYLSSTNAPATAGSTGSPHDWHDSTPNSSGGYVTNLSCSASFSYKYVIIDMSSWSFSGTYFGELMYLPFGLSGKEGDIVYIDSITLCTTYDVAQEFGKMRSNPYEDSYLDIGNETNGPEDGKYYVQNYRYGWGGMYEGFAYGSAPSSISVDANGSPSSTGRYTDPRASLNTTVTSSQVSNGDILSTDSLYTDEDTWTFTWSGLPTRSYYDFVGWYYYRYVSKGPLLDDHSESGKQLLKSFISKTSNNNYSLTMDGVDDSHVEPRIYAAWEPTEYSITYNLNGGSISGQKTSYNIETSTFTLPTPTRSGYIFTGWTGSNGSTPQTTVTISKGSNGDKSYTAHWQPNTYTVTWNNYDGTTLETDTGVAYNTTPSYNGATPTKPADAQYTYTFTGWSPAVGPITGNTTYTAQFSSSTNSYPITWLNWDGTNLGTTSVDYGQTPVAPVTPSRPATAEYTYTFAGWTPEIDSVTGAATYTATYTATKNKYTVTWVDGNGDILKTEQLEYGATPSYTGSTPTKADDADYSYTFNGSWSPAITTVTGNVTYTAQFDGTLLGYTVTWKDWDGDVIETDTAVKIGTIPSYDGATPTRPATAEFTYTFNGWSPTVSAVTGDVTYTAQYTETKNSYTVTFVDEDGTTVIDQQSVLYGEMPTPPADPEKADTAEWDYTFTGWSPAISQVIGDSVYTAQYSAAKQKYTVTFYDEDGVTVLDTQVLEYGVMPEYKGPAPTKAEDEQYSYTFEGWSPAIGEVRRNAVYRAYYTATVKQYTVTFLNWDNSLLYSAVFDYGTLPTYVGETPTKAPGIDRVYTFSGWTPDITEVTGEATYTAKFSSALRSYTITWLNWDGSLITSSEALFGTTPTYPGETPVRPDSDAFTYTFEGWDPALYTVIGEQTYTAVYSESSKLADLLIKVMGTQSIDENQSYIFDIVKPDSSTLTVVVYGDDTVTVKDVPVGSYAVSEKDDWSWRYENDKQNSTQTLILSSSPNTEDEDLTNDNTAYFTQTRVEKPAEKALWLGGDGYKKYKPDSDDEGAENQ